MPLQELWRLQYRRNPYMRLLSNAQLRDRWDELTVCNLIMFIKNAPLRFAKQEIEKHMEQFGHVIEEIARRGLPMPMFKAEKGRIMAAAIRLRLPPAALAWVAAQVGQKPAAAG